MASIDNLGFGTAGVPVFSSKPKTVFDQVAANLLQTAVVAPKETVKKVKAAVVEPNPIEPQIISKKEFDKIFSGENNVEADNRDIDNVGTAMCTTSAKTCIAVAAVCYQNATPFKVGIFHYCVETSRLERFLDKVHADATRVHLYIIGSYETEREDFMEVVESFKKKTNVVYLNLNPSNVDLEVYGNHAAYVDGKFDFGVSLGITSDLKILLPMKLPE